MVESVAESVKSMGEQFADPWFWFGLTGNACFFGRFLLQWIVSERMGRSVVPRGFWYMSLVGSLILVIYAFHRIDAVFVLGQTTGFIVYIRNLVLLSRAGTRLSAGL